MENFGLFILRVIPASFMLLAHGWGKLVSFPERMTQFADPLGVGSPASLTLVVFAEVVCSVLLILGIGTRLAAIPLLITMLVAGFIIHAADPWAKQEFALLYGTIFLTLFFTGGGRFGFGGRLFRSKWLNS